MSKIDGLSPPRRKVKGVHFCRVSFWHMHKTQQSAKTGWEAAVYPYARDRGGIHGNYSLEDARASSAARLQITTRR